VRLERGEQLTVGAVGLHEVGEAERRRLSQLVLVRREVGHHHWYAARLPARGVTASCFRRVPAVAPLGTPGPHGGTQDLRVRKMRRTAATASLAASFWWVRLTSAIMPERPTSSTETCPSASHTVCHGPSPARSRTVRPTSLSSRLQRFRRLSKL
jgi:hypothetical protein